jgi:hypothetical protein
MKEGKAKLASGGAKPQAPAADVPASATCVPLKPRPKLFWALMLSFAIWLGALLTLYFKTVYPDRHPSTAATRPGASGLPSAPR